MTDFRPGLRRILIELAATRRTATYKELAERAQVPPPHTIHKLTEALEEMIREDAAAGRPLLAATAIGRGPEGIPGRGFFLLAAELALYTGPDHGPPAQAFHAGELERVFGHWSGRA